MRDRNIYIINDIDDFTSKVDTNIIIGENGDINYIDNGLSNKIVNSEDLKIFYEGISNGYYINKLLDLYANKFHNIYRDLKNYLM